MLLEQEMVAACMYLIYQLQRIDHGGSVMEYNSCRLWWGQFFWALEMSISR
jgi:hypothetical protein